MFQEGGYEYDFVHAPVPNEQLCLMCTLVAREAHQVNCYGMIICRGCWRSWKGNVIVCLICSKDLEGKSLQGILAICNINHFKVYCKNKKRGCTWRGELHIWKKSAPLEEQSALIATKWEAMPTSAWTTGRNALISTLTALTRAAEQSQNERVWKLIVSSVQQTLSSECADFGCEHICQREDRLQHTKLQVHDHLQLAMTCRC